MKRLMQLLLLSAVLVTGATSVSAGEVKPVEVAEIKALLARGAEGKYLLVDARPEIKYFEGHLPGAVSLSWLEMRERLSELPTDKATQLVFYCAGVKCDLSGKAAALAVANGYRNVGVFAGGEPGWRAAGESLWVSTNYIKMLLNDRERVAMIIDARSQVKYLEGTIPGALNLPFQEWERRQGLLPSDKAATLVFFCGGVKCDLSHKSAAKARELGYTDVRIYSDGWPVWQEQSPRAFALVDPKAGGKEAPAAEAAVNPGEIGKDEFLRFVKERPAGSLLVDVRPAAQYALGHLSGAISIPDEELAKHAVELKQAGSVVFYCATGSRSAGAYYAAEDLGVKNTRYLSRNVDIAADGSFSVH